MPENLLAMAVELQRTSQAEEAQDSNRLVG